MAIYQIHAEAILNVEADSEEEAKRKYYDEDYEVELTFLKSVKGPIKNKNEV